jgi:hypothetical protein
MGASSKNPASASTLGGAIINSKHINSNLAAPSKQVDFAVLYVANRYRLPIHLARVVAVLAEIGWAS